MKSAAFAFLLSIVTICEGTKQRGSLRNGYEELCGPFPKCRCPTTLNPNSFVDCSNGLWSMLVVAISFPDDIRKVSFKSNSIKEVQADVFASAKNVDYLDLSFNAIENIELNAFQSFENLTILELERNKISSIYLDTLKGLNKLQILDLSYNSISEIQPEVFKHCVGLRELDLKYNPLRGIHHITFSYLKNLKVLSLQNVGVHTIPDKLFGNNTELEVLVLDNNALQEVPSASFQYLHSLKYLMLSGNPIEVIEPNAFQGLKNLQVLYLSHIKTLTCIKKHAFGALNRLQQFHCNYCPMLTTIDSRAFKTTGSGENFTTLEQVSLRENALESLSEDLLPYSRLLVLDLAENPWQCDCNIRWMTSLPVKTKEQVRCAGPSKVENRLLTSLSAGEMTCSTFNLGAAIAVAVLCAILLSALIIFIVVKIYQKGMLCGAPQRKYARVMAKRERRNMTYEPTTTA